MTKVNEFDLEPLTEEQTRELARNIIDKFGVGLSRDDLDESIRVVIENVPVLELESTQAIHQLVETIRRKYNDEIHRIKSRS